MMNILNYAHMENMCNEQCIVRWFVAFVYYMVREEVCCILRSEKNAAVHVGFLLGAVDIQQAPNSGVLLHKQGNIHFTRTCCI